MPEELEFYIPHQYLELFEYTEKQGVTNILSSIRVDLHAGESIEIQELEFNNEFSISMELKVIVDKEEEEDYEWRGEILIPVISEQCYDETVTDTEEKKTRVKNELEDLLQRNNSTFFFVHARVVNLDGSDGSEVTNTINGSSQVEIDAT